MQSEQLNQFVLSTHEVAELEVVTNGSEDTLFVITPTEFQNGAALRETLFNRMSGIPSQFDILVTPEIPRRTDNSVDLDRVRLLTETSIYYYKYREPKTYQEASICEAINDLLPSPLRISATDSLSDLGGDSVMAIELSQILTSKCGTYIDPSELYMAESVTEIASYLDRATNQSEFTEG